MIVTGIAAMLGKGGVVEVRGKVGSRTVWARFVYVYLTFHSFSLQLQDTHLYGT